MPPSSSVFVLVVQDASSLDIMAAASVPCHDGLLQVSLEL